MIVNINRYKIYPLVFISRPKCLQLFTCVRRMRELCSILLEENKSKVWVLWHLLWKSNIIERMFPLWVGCWGQYSLLLQYWILEKLVTYLQYKCYFIILCLVGNLKRIVEGIVEQRERQDNYKIISPTNWNLLSYKNDNTFFFFPL